MSLTKVQTSREQNYTSFDQNVESHIPHYEYDALVLGDCSTVTPVEFDQLCQKLEPFFVLSKESIQGKEMCLNWEEAVPLDNAVHGATASMGVTGVCDSMWLWPLVSDFSVVCLQKDNFSRHVSH